MSSSLEVLTAIRAYAALARRRRLHGISTDDRRAMDALEEVLRDSIDGARPAPKRLEDPAPAATSVRHVSPPTPAPPAPPESADVAPETPLMTPQDAQKLHAVSTRDIPTSHYTPPAGHPFLSDYYDEDLVPALVDGTESVTEVVDPTGATMDLDREVRLLLGIDPLVRPGPATVPDRPVRPSADSTVSGPAQPAPPAQPTSGAAASSMEAAGMKVIIHRLSGEPLRGVLTAFDPTAPELEIIERTHKQPFRIATRDVLAIFYGARRGHPMVEAQGHRLIVQLTNGRHVRGCSPDYTAGAAALTLVPEPRRGNIDYIWVPAWAVQGIDYG